MVGATVVSFGALAIVLCFCFPCNGLCVLFGGNKEYSCCLLSLSLLLLLVVVVVVVLLLSCSVYHSALLSIGRRCTQFTKNETVGIRASVSVLARFMTYFNMFNPKKYITRKKVKPH